MEIVEFQKRFNTELQTWCEHKMADIIDLTTVPFVRDQVIHSCKLITSSGKRVRPYLCYLVYRALGGRDDTAIIQLGIALELLHTFSLIHDDWMDHGNERRGITTMHIFAKQRLQADNRQGDLDHVAASQAVLAGDMLFGWVYQVLVPLATKGQVLPIVMKMIDELVVGQMIDVDLTTRNTVSEAELQQKMLLKTASYSFIYPLQLGVALADGTQSDYEACSNIGTALGLAFQIQDDLFDLLNEEADLGKNTFSDLAAHQHTYYTQYILDRGTTAEQELLHQYWGKPITKAQQQELRLMFINSGAIGYAKQHMITYFDAAESAVRSWNMDGQADLLAMITYIRNRQV
ncbi:polyprenyl synthetase family protein [Candidatus Gracilibacteria bacterium]|nr:polyprenyl synthetase family protein [Candidatus Gracilibacteria bacterium]